MDVLTSLPHIARNARRFREIAAVLAKYGLAEWIAADDPKFLRGLVTGPAGESLAGLSRERRVRMALSDLGATFVKLGQLLSTRADLVGPELAGELSKLQSDMPPEPAPAIRAVVEEDLGRPVAELFRDFEDAPLAAASIGQVHAATLPDGTRVVVKVRRPGVEERVKADLDILMGLAELAEKGVLELRLYQPRATAAELRRTLVRELDFAREARNIGHFRANFAADAQVAFPAVFPALSSPRVLTMERFFGAPISDAARLDASGRDPGQAARQAANVFLEMIFRDSFFHADPHPGNLWVLDDGRLGILDCGMVGRLDSHSRRDMEDILMSVVEGDADRLAELTLRIGNAPTDLDRAGYRLEIDDFVTDYVDQPLGTLDLSGALTGITAIIRHNRILLPTSVALLVKVFIMLEGATRSLSPGFSLMEIMKPYQAKIASRRFSAASLLRKAGRMYADWNQLFAELPREAMEILRRARSGKLDVHLVHRGLDETVNRLVYGVMTAALFLGSCLIVATRIPPLIGGVSFFGGLGCVFSIYQALRLLRAIRKSGDLFPKK